CTLSRYWVISVSLLSVVDGAESGGPGGHLNLTTNGVTAKRQLRSNFFTDRSRATSVWTWSFCRGPRESARPLREAPLRAGSWGDMPDWGALYRQHVAALSELAPTLTEEQLGSAVPGTPAWSVREVYAHLAGGASDAVTGRMDGAPSPEWTSRHVNERVLLPMAELVTELQSHQDAIADSVADNG